MCRRVLARGGRAAGDLCRVHFHYTRDDGGAWRGAVSLETFGQLAAVNADRAALDARLLDALRAAWTADTQDMALQLGIPISKPAPGPYWRVYRGANNELLAPTPELQAIHDDLVGLVRRHGRTRLARYKLHTTDPDAGLRVELQYW